MAGSASTYNIEWHYGDNLNGIEVVWKDSDGVVVDISGYVASLKVKDSNGNEKLYLDSDTLLGLTVTGVEGKVTIDATPARMVSETLEGGNTYLYDLQIKNAAGTIIKTLIRGTFKVDKEQTDV